MGASRNMAKFCANISFMFSERPFLERYKLAKEAGFKAVESAFPNDISIEQVVNAKNASGVEQILVNIFAGDPSKGEAGFAALTGKSEEFKQSLDLTIKYAKALNAKKIHIMSGKVPNPSLENHEVYECNLKYAARVLEKENILGLIEPINNYSVPDYYLNDYNRAVHLIRKIGSSNLKLMLDIFHLQHLKGNITNSINEYKDIIGHVQIAQVPHRNEPNTLGEINYKYVLDHLQQHYSDWIGLEYKPAKDVQGGLNWISEMGYEL